MRILTPSFVASAKVLRPFLTVFFGLLVGFVYPGQLPSSMNEREPRSIYPANTLKNQKYTQIGSLSNMLRAPTPETHILSATYYRMDSNFESVLMVSNQGPNPMPVQVTLFSLSGEVFDLPLAMLSGQEVRAFDLRNYVHSSDFQEGSLQVAYQGRKLELGGVLQVADSHHSLMFDEELSETKYFASAKLEGVWWTSFTDADLRLALSNTTSEPTAATVSIEGVSPKQLNAQTIYLQPHQTRVLSISEITGGQIANIKKAGAVSITHNGFAGGILAHGMISKADVGYSGVIEFIDPAKQKTTSINGVGLRFGKVNGQRLVQGIVAHNAGLTPVKLSGYLSYATENDAGEAAIPETLLDPGEVREINVPAFLASRTDIVASGLHFEHNGEPGQVVIAASSVSQSGRE